MVILKKKKIQNYKLILIRNRLKQKNNKFPKIQIGTFVLISYLYYFKGKIKRRHISGFCIKKKNAKKNTSVTVRNGIKNIKIDFRVLIYSSIILGLKIIRFKRNYKRSLVKKFKFLP